MNKIYDVEIERDGDIIRVSQSYGHEEDTILLDLVQVDIFCKLVKKAAAHQDEDGGE